MNHLQTLQDNIPFKEYLTLDFAKDIELQNYLNLDFAKDIELKNYLNLDFAKQIEVQNYLNLDLVREVDVKGYLTFDIRNNLQLPDKVKQELYNTPQNMKNHMSKLGHRIKDSYGDYFLQKKGKREFRKRKIKIKSDVPLQTLLSQINFQSDQQSRHEKVLINLVELDTPSLIMHLINVDLRALIDEVAFKDYVVHCLVQILWKVSQEEGRLVEKAVAEFLASQFFQKLQVGFIASVYQLQKSEDMDDYQFAIYQLVHALDCMLDICPEYNELYPVREIKKAIDIMDIYCKDKGFSLEIPLPEMRYLVDQLWIKFISVQREFNESSPKKLHQQRIQLAMQRQKSAAEGVRKSLKKRRRGAKKQATEVSIREKLNNWYYEESMVRRELIQMELMVMEAKRKQGFIDRNFDLLVNQINFTLVEAVTEFVEKRATPEYIQSKYPHIQVFANSQLYNLVLNHEDIHFLFKVKTKLSIKKAFLPGQMVLISCDEFLTSLIGIVQSRDFDRSTHTSSKFGYTPLAIRVLNLPQYQEEEDGDRAVMDFYHENLGKFYDVFLLKSAYYEKDVQTLEKLDSMSQWVTPVPFQDYFINPRAASQNKPAYVGFSNQDFLDEVYVDPEIRQALMFALDNELALVKGQPGTGKTHLVTSLVKTLCKMVDSWRSRGPILVVTSREEVTKEVFQRVKEYCQNVLILDDFDERNPYHQPYKPFTLLEKCLLSQKMERLTYNLRTAIHGFERAFFSSKSKVNLLYLGVVSSHLGGSCGQFLRELEIDVIRVLKGLVPNRFRDAQADKVWKFVVTLLRYQPNVLVLFWLEVVQLNTYIQQMFQEDPILIQMTIQDMEKSMQAKKHFPRAQGWRVRDEKFFQEEGACVEQEHAQEDCLAFLEHFFQDGSQNQQFYKECETFVDCVNRGLEQGVAEGPIAHHGNYFDMPLELRWQLNNQMIRMEQRQLKLLKETASVHLEDYQKAMRQKIEIDNYCIQEFLKEADVILLSPNSFAKFQQQVKKLSVPIVIVDDAEFIQEPELVSFISRRTEHMILTGSMQDDVCRNSQNNNQDESLALPRQPSRPNDEEEPFFSNVFEKLCAYNKENVFELKLQKRVKPEISSLLLFFTSELLQNNKNVQSLPNVKGIQQSLFFYDSNPKKNLSGMESFAQSEIGGNLSELTMLFKFTQYLLQQGYTTEEVRVVTLTTEQKKHVQKVKESMNCKELCKVEVTTVGRLEGLEVDILVLHLSWPSGKLVQQMHQLLKTAFSRARYGLFIFGSSSQFLEQDPELWHGLLNYLSAQSYIGEELTLVCQTHSTTNIISDPDDFNSLVPDGGCKEVCGAELKCGHLCPRKCHPFQLNNQFPRGHQGQKCREVCLGRQKICGHPCEYKCYKCQPQCRPCKTVIQKKMLACNHVVDVECGKATSLQLCPAECDRKLRCGHKCQQQCFESCYKTKCQQKVDKPYPCKHLNSLPCHLPVRKALQTLPCASRCTFKLECGHVCSGTCVKCSKKGKHKLCRRDCDKVLNCGHKCLNKCSKVCAPCTSACEFECQHGNKCQKLCKEQCSDCYEECWNECKHSKCTRTCLQFCNKLQCNEKCELKLECGHKCMGLCGEKCPDVCFTCNEGLEEGSVYIQLPCFHLFKVPDLDKKVSEFRAQTSGLKFLECPECRAQIRGVKRYIPIQNMIYEDFQRAKAESLTYNADCDQIAVDIQKWIKNMHEQIDNCGIKSQYVAYLQSQFARMEKVQEKVTFLRCKYTMKRFLRRIQLEHMILPLDLYYHYFQTSLFQKSVNQFAGQLLKHNQDSCGLIKVTASIQESDSERDSLKVEIHMETLGLVTCTWHKCVKDHVFVEKVVNGEVEIEGCNECDKRTGILGAVDDIRGFLSQTIKQTEKIIPIFK